MLLPRHKEIILNFWEHSSGPHHHHFPDKIESMTDPKPTLFFFLSTLPSLSHIKWFFSLSPELMITQQTTQLVAQRLKHLPAMWETWVWSLGREDPLEKEMATPVFLPGESHGRRSLVGYSPQGCKESNTTERLHFTRDYITTMYPAWGQFLLPENLLTNPDILERKLWEWVW